MKKNYIIPEQRVVKISTTNILADSVLKSQSLDTDDSDKVKAEADWANGW